MGFSDLSGVGLCSKKRGGVLYAVITLTLGVLACLPFLFNSLGWISYDDIQKYAVLSAPVVVVCVAPFSPARLLAPVLGSTQPATWNYAIGFLGLVMTSLLYYAIILAPVGVLLVSTNGHLSKSKGETASYIVSLGILAISQAILLVPHVFLVNAGLALLRW